ncbi:relaxase/mobilization nuclease RlxS [Sphingobium sp. DEHP117]|uniref:relaxase/mobilization nuclease RlxS n=1 Tax=Sphingobium sp. DEHP117 TaxID=2993436 RepID=UPI0027D617A0|nr:relaxase/mobilization nuclease RlxS [Sphingobium sp. DEHP117]MDQ4419034.1 relaxase/mobilization nuclease RlxS [Sphingobium sp. DEHP117]
MADRDDFDLWLGRIGSDTPSVGKSLARARRMGGRVGGAARRFTGARLGRGSGVGRVLSRGASRAGAGTRRVVVKSRIVKLGRGMAVGAHLRYLQRDGTTREGERGSLYGRDADRLDGRPFLERSSGDRHQFRFIVAPEDGDQYDDLKPVVRRLMDQAEKDLGTKLDWVAVDHFNTGHPHAHVIVRGKDEVGKDLIIARDYMTQGLRARAIAIVSLDLGPRTAQEIAAAQAREIEQERFTGIDRALMRGANEEGVIAVTKADPGQHASLIGRLRTLSRLGLAEEGRNGRWTLDRELELTLRRMGERGDIIRTLNRELREAGILRPPQNHSLFEPAQEKAIIGRVVATGLSDEHRDRRYLIVDGIDSHSHYADIGEDQQSFATGSIVRLSPAPVEVREVDRTIAHVAARQQGHYSIDHHLRQDPLMTEERAQAYVRRLEAIRRTIGKPERQPDGVWVIGQDHLADAERYEREKSRRVPVCIETLSHRPLEALPHHDGATWLDRELVSDQCEKLSGGFGVDVRNSLAQRQAWLVEQGLAELEGPDIRLRRNLLLVLQQRELNRTSQQISEETGLRHVTPRRGEPIEGIYRRAVMVGDQRYAMIEKSREFSLVPWRPVLERAVGKSVMGVMRDGPISWTIGGRNRGLGIS